jgi:hypothetical protein
MAARFRVDGLGVSFPTKKSNTLTAGPGEDLKPGAADGGEGAAGGGSTIVMVPLLSSSASSTYAC